MIRVRIEGGAELARSLNQLSERLSRKVMRNALIAGGEPMRTAIETNAPRRPGKPDIADNIIISNARPEDGSVGIAIGPASPFFYGGFNELGTAHQPARPFVRPAFDGEVHRALGIVQADVWDALIRRGVAGTRGAGGGGGLE